jgi:ubiquinone/menaquinone biosynthesis C-methylase UbiE
MSTRTASLAVLLALAVGGCGHKAADAQFPSANRPVAPTVSSTFSTEDARDRLGEAEEVIRLAGVTRGMWVADIGAGQGYYTVRLSPVVGPKGRVLAEDIVRETTDQLSERVQRERLDNVAVKLGAADDPMLPAASIDRVFLVHMYHEVQSPYAFLWHVREATKPGGQFIVVDSDRPTQHHGIPPAQLKCEFAALNLRPVRFARLRDRDEYLMAFVVAGPRPAPEQIRPCRA